jgi:NADH-quinone oxidoreductase subunit L
MVTESHLLRWIVALPALGVLFHVFVGRRATSAVKVVGPGLVLAAFGLAVHCALVLRALGPDAVLGDRVYQWIAAGAFSADVAFRLDALSAVMVLVVTGVGFLIHVYSVGYMHHDPGFARYFAYLNLFTTSMLILVLADNLLLLFVGWEGVGLCSYLLISFWYDKVENAVAGKKAFLVNRIGDAAFLLGLFLLVWTVGDGRDGVWTLDLATLEHHRDVLAGSVVGGWPVATVVALLLFVGATGKSAQIPLYVWLPDAMAGPTPVSALIHAATMVTAGVYLLARLEWLYALAPAALAVVAVVGAATALLAGVIATAQMDIKKVLAYSTVSQLGYMFLALGVGVPGAAVFHLVTHAFFKALLFLGAGSVIHGLSGEQDMERMGGLRREMPITFATMTVGVLALAGVWPLSGFFSKDEILWGAFAAGAHPMPALGVVGLVVALLTAYYGGRLLFLTFFGESRVTEHARHHLHESPAVMTVPLVVLALLSIAGGFLPVPAVVAPIVGGEAHGHAAHAPLGFMALALGLALGGLALAGVFYGRLPGLPAILAWRLGAVYRLVRDKLRVDELYDVLVVRPLFALARVCAGLIDPRLIDGAANGAALLVAATAGVWRRAQTGNVQHYALSFLVGALVLLGWYAGR